MLTVYFVCQAEWGPLRHVRVIKERNSGISRGFAFIDFLSVVLMSFNLIHFLFPILIIELKPKCFCRTGSSMCYDGQTGGGWSCC